MMAATLVRDEKLYAVLRASSTYEDSPVQTCLVELTPERLTEWRDRLNRAKAMKEEHGVAYVAWPDYSPEWWPSDYEAEPLDDDCGEVYPPAQGDDELRVELSRVEVDEHSLDFTCFAKHSSERLTASLYEKDLAELVQRLEAHNGAKPKG